MERAEVWDSNEAVINVTSHSSLHKQTHKYSLLLAVLPYLLWVITNLEKLKQIIINYYYILFILY